MSTGEVWTITVQNTSSGISINIWILKAKSLRDTIWRNIAIMFGALHNLLKTENVKLQQVNETMWRNERKCKKKKKLKQNKTKNRQVMERGAGMAQWWEHSPSTYVARVRFPDPASYVGWVCWFLFSAPRGFLRVLRFPLSSKLPVFDLICVSCVQFIVSLISLGILACIF